MSSQATWISCANFHAKFSLNSEVAPLSYQDMNVIKKLQIMPSMLSAALVTMGLTSSQASNNEQNCLPLVTTHNLISPLLPVSLELVETKSNSYPEFTITHNTYIHKSPFRPNIYQRVKILVPNSATKDTPVFFNQTGQGGFTFDGIGVQKLYEVYGQRKNLIYIQAEHRGYGLSLSSESDQSRPKYVSVKGAIADSNRVISHLKKQFQGKWIGAGWSYSGSLIVELAYKYPSHFDALMVSGTPLKWPIVTDVFSRKIEAAFGSTDFKRLKDHYSSIDVKSSNPLSQGWIDRIFLSSFLRVSVQHPKGVALQDAIREMSLLPTPDFLRELKALDAKPISKGGGSRFNLSWAEAHTLKKYSLEDAKGQVHQWRNWYYQMCSELGIFTVAQDSVFFSRIEDHVLKCIVMFGIDPRLEILKPRDIEQRLMELRLPVIVVSGLRDPWLELGLKKELDPTIGKHIVVDGVHGPDRYDPKLSSKIVDELLRYIH